MGSDMLHVVFSLVEFCQNPFFKSCVETARIPAPTKRRLTLAGHEALAQDFLQGPAVDSGQAFFAVGLGEQRGPGDGDGIASWMILLANGRSVHKVSIRHLPSISFSGAHEDPFHRRPSRGWGGVGSRGDVSHGSLLVIHPRYAGKASHLPRISLSTPRADLSSSDWAGRGTRENGRMLFGCSFAVSGQVTGHLPRISFSGLHRRTSTRPFCSSAGAGC